MLHLRRVCNHSFLLNRTGNSLFRTIRCFSGANNAENVPRESMQYDVVIVGAGPAGLSAAIRLKQLSAKNNKDLSVCVVEKGSEVGAHILSGNVFEPRALNELFPDWKERGAPISTAVAEDQFLVLSKSKSYKLPHFLLPKQLRNDGNYVISLSQLVRWLGKEAESLGIEIYPGFSGSEVLYTEDGKGIRGIATRDAGISQAGVAKETFTRGIEIHAKQTIFAEGCRGSCSEEIMTKFDLRNKNGADVQTYGLGIKEDNRPGYVQHTLGWPLQTSITAKTFGGGFLYHLEPNMVVLGLVVGLDYQNAYTNPYLAMQEWKHHPDVRVHIDGGRCVGYGGRVLNEGGFHAIPKLTVPGGLLVGCAAGFLNAIKIKGSHTAIKSGMVSAEAVFNSIITTTTATSDQPIEVSAYQTMMEQSWVYEELKQVRNCHAPFSLGAIFGFLYSGFSAWISKGREPWTFKNKIPDSAKTLPLAESEKIVYQKPDGKLSFDILTNLARAGTNHESDQPKHLRIKTGMEDGPASSFKKFGGVEQKFCPAGVYEHIVDDKGNHESLTINAQNCIHCKCCSIKTPTEYIQWTVPEGSGGPNYTVM